MESRVRFESMYRAHGAAVRSFVHRRVPAGEADDVVADVFVAAWRRIEDAPDETLPWLLGIARGALANRRRGADRRRALNERLTGTVAPGVQPGPEPTVVGSDSPLLRALASLGERDQEVLRLVAWDGLERSQAAAVLGISPGQFSVRLHRAKRRLARAVAAGENHDRPTDEHPFLEASR